MSKTKLGRKNKDLIIFKVFVPNCLNIKKNEWLLKKVSRITEIKLVKVGFSSTWTKNFQMSKLDLEKAEEPKIKLPTTVGSSKKQESYRKTSALLTTSKLLTVWITANWKILKDIGIWDDLTCLPWNLYAGKEAIVRTKRGTIDGLQIGKGVCQGWYIVTLFI